MKKKVRYALAAAGVAPAMGLMMPAITAAAASAHVGKTVRTSAGAHQQSVSTNTKCAGNDLASKTGGFISMSFYWAPHNADICIGTMHANVQPGFALNSITMHVHTVNGNFCNFTNGGNNGTWGCHDPFTKNGLEVWGANSPARGPTWVGSPWPFRDPS